MTKRFEVLWTTDAELDASNIVACFDHDADAERIIVRLGVVAQSLRTFPRRGRIVPELQRIGISHVHEILSKPWRIMYRIEDHRVLILGVFDGRRDLVDILFERMIR